MVKPQTYLVQMSQNCIHYPDSITGLTCRSDRLSHRRQTLNLIDKQADEVVGLLQVLKNRCKHLGDESGRLREPLGHQIDGVDLN